MQRRYLEMPDSTATGDLWNPPSAESCECSFLQLILSPLSADAVASSSSSSSATNTKRHIFPTDLLFLSVAANGFDYR